jgi:hypothetical protein
MREASSRVPRRERLHVVKRVLAVGRGVVRHDGNGADTDLAQSVSFCHYPVNTGFSI